MSKRNRKEKYLFIRFEPELYNQIKKVAAIETEGNMSMLVREAVREFIANHGK
jgi:hypothetical protein